MLAKRISTLYAVNLKASNKAYQIDVPFVTGRSKSWALTIEPENDSGAEEEKDIFDLPEQDPCRFRLISEKSGIFFSFQALVLKRWRCAMASSAFSDVLNKYIALAKINPCELPHKLQAGGAQIKISTQITSTV